MTPPLTSFVLLVRSQIWVTCISPTLCYKPASSLMPRFWPGFAVLFLATVVASPAAADEALALKSFENGRRLFEAHDYADALRAFETSHDAMPSPNTRLYVARCLREQGKVARAYAAFLLVSREAEDRVRATGDKRYVPTQKSAALEAERLKPLVPHVTLRLVPAAGTRATDLERASVTLDGQPLAKAQLASPLDLDPGAHALVVTGPHLKRTESAVTVSASETKTLDVPVERVPFGKIVVALKTRPAGLAVELDGEPIDVTNKTYEVGVGAHRVAARAPGHAAFAWNGNLADEGQADVLVDLAPEAVFGPAAAPSTTPTGGTPKWLFFGTAGLAVASLGVGTFFVMDARASDREEAAKPIGERDAAARDDLRGRAEIGSALLVTGGVLAVAAGVLAITTQWKTPKSTGQLPTMIGGTF